MIGTLCKGGKNHEVRFAEWVFYPEKDGEEIAVKGRLGQCMVCKVPVYEEADTEKFIRDYLWAGHVFKVERSIVGFTANCDDFEGFYCKSETFSGLESAIYEELLTCMGRYG
jgi:hypothetical protein